MSKAPTMTFDEDLLQMRRKRALAARLADPAGSPDFLLEHVAQDLAMRLGTVNRHFKDAIDLYGTGGNIAAALSSLKSVSNVNRIEMAHHVPGDCPVQIVSSDRLALEHNSKDLIVSAFALHWCNDIAAVLAIIKQALRPDGLFLAVLPGPATLTELRQCFAIAENQIWNGISPRVDPFITLNSAGQLLQQAGFALPVADTDKIIVRYDNAQDLMHDLRAMGATNILLQREKSRFSKTLFSKLAEIYAEKFADADGRIRATFEFISLSGWAPHASQQKPLEPGSATSRLIDGLKQHTLK